MVFVRRRDYWFRYYLAFVIAFFLLMLFQTFKFFYDLAALPQTALMIRVFTGLFLLVLNFMVYLLPFFATWLARKPWRGWPSIIFSFLAAAYFFMVVLYAVFFPHSGALYAGLVLIFAVMTVFSMVLLTLRRKRIASTRMRSLCLSFVVLSAAFCPLILVDALLTFLPAGLRSFFPTGVIAFPLYFLWFNVVALVYLVGYFVHLPQAESDGPSQDRLTELKITERERDIIRLLAQGLTYKEIGDKLCISFHTVNNHVANIYAKAGARNRIDLLRVLS